VSKGARRDEGDSTGPDEEKTDTISQGPTEEEAEESGEWKPGVAERVPGRAFGASVLPSSSCS